jgi:hypothetical protein
MSTTPRMLAEAHCANWQNGQCLGLDFDLAGKHFRFRPAGRCWLCTPTERCSYFEEAVMPLQIEHKVAEVEVKLRKHFREGVLAYKKAIGEPVSKAALEGEPICPRCYARPPQTGRRYCLTCQQIV